MISHTRLTKNPMSFLACAHPIMEKIHEVNSIEGSE